MRNTTISVNHTWIKNLYQGRGLLPQVFTPVLALYAKDTPSLSNQNLKPFSVLQENRSVLLGPGDADQTEPWHILALRGCVQIQAATLSRVKKVDLRKVNVDYKTQRCTFILWKYTSAFFYVFPGSTVPYIQEVKKAALLGGKGANRLEPGFYTDLTLGIHQEGKPRGHVALRQTARRPIRRSKGKPFYNQKDPLYFSNPYDNLHASWNSQPHTAGYASAGCLVISGIPNCPLHSQSKAQGPWKKFIELFLKANQKKAKLLLIPAAFCAKSDVGNLTESFPQKLIYGQVGPKIAAWQKQLKAQGLYKGKINGQLTSSTYKIACQQGLLK